MSNCSNEWDHLEEVIVGAANGSKIPTPTTSLMSCVYPEYEKEYIETLVGTWRPEILREQIDDLEILAQTLEQLGVKVYRPEIGMNTLFDWHWHCPRDLTLVIGNKIIETPSPIENRKNENKAYEYIFKKYNEEKGYDWIKAARPSFRDENYQTDDINRKPTLLNKEPKFEAANCMKINNDILYQISNTGNELGGQWLQEILGNEYKVHILHDLYSYAHLDSTIIPLREGLVLYNASRVTEDNQPELFKSWDKIWIDECYSAPKKYDVPWAASEWIGLNLLSVNPNLAIVDRKQKQLIEKLNKHKIEVIPLELRHDRIISGGFHCVTLDLSRKAK